MRISLNDKTVVVPSSLSEITLKQRIDFQNEHGPALLELIESVNKIENELDRELAIAEFQMEKMYRTFSFFTGVTVNAIKQSQFVDQVANIFFACFNQFLEEDENIEPETEFAWNKELWVISAPELVHGSKMTFGEFIDSKQMVQNMIKLGKNKWECMIPLAAIFLRKQDEPYREEFLYEGSDRLKLMESLPMHIAVQVAFFLNSSLNMYMKTFQSSFQTEQKETISS